MSDEIIPEKWKVRHGDVNKRHKRASLYIVMIFRDDDISAPSMFFRECFALYIADEFIGAEDCPAARDGGIENNEGVLEFLCRPVQRIDDLLTEINAGSS